MPRTSDAKEKLILAATKLIWENSYGVVSVDSICEQAGVRKGSFYHFFASKEALALAVVELEWEQFRKMMDSCFSPLVPPAERFERIHNAAMDEQRQQKERFGRVCGCPLFSLGCEIGTQDSPLREKVAEIMRAGRLYYASAIRDGIAAGVFAKGNADVKAELVQSYIYGAISQGRILNTLEPMERSLDGVFEILGHTKLTK